MPRDSSHSASSMRAAGTLKLRVYLVFPVNIDTCGPRCKCCSSRKLNYITLHCRRTLLEHSVRGSVHFPRSLLEIARLPFSRIRVHLTKLIWADMTRFASAEVCRDKYIYLLGKHTFRSSFPLPPPTSMKPLSYFAILAAICGSNAQLVNPNNNTFGNVFNFWTKTMDGWDVGHHSHR